MPTPSWFISKKFNILKMSPSLNHSSPRLSMNCLDASIARDGGSDGAGGGGGGAGAGGDTVDENETGTGAGSENKTGACAEGENEAGAGVGGESEAGTGTAGGSASDRSAFIAVGESMYMGDPAAGGPVAGGMVGTTVDCGIVHGPVPGDGPSTTVFLRSFK